MSRKVAFPITFFKWKINKTQSLARSILSETKPFSGNGIPKIKRQLRKHFQAILEKKEESENADLLTSFLLQEQPGEAFQKASFDYRLKTGAAEPIILPFDYYYREAKPGVFGAILPVIPLYATGRSTAELEEVFGAQINHFFARKQKVSPLLAALAWQSTGKVRIKPANIKLRIPTLAAHKKSARKKKKVWLPSVGKPLKIKEQKLFGYEEELRKVRRFSDSFAPKILLVGSEHVGKTTLVYEFARSLKSSKIYETSAEELIAVLSQGSGWEVNINNLFAELKHTDDWLFIKNYYALFKVGQYFGNEISIAQYIQNRLDGIRLISELRPEELDAIKKDHPGYLNDFKTVTLQPVKNKDLFFEIIHDKITAHPSKPVISEAAIQAAYYLHLRFGEFSGEIGVISTFFENIIASKGQVQKSPKITPADVYELFHLHTGIPLQFIDANRPLDVQQMNRFFAERVFGQDAAINKLTGTLLELKTGMVKAGKPIASFLFSGPTGVGKTELAKVLSLFMYGREDAMKRFDMSEYAENHFKLINTPSHDSLTGAVLNNPFSLILLDEIEKANKEVQDILLQILDAGRYTDPNGKVINFSSCIIILTSNIGGSKSVRQMPGFSRKQTDPTEVIIAELEKHLKPELINRFDQIIPFLPLTPANIEQVLERELLLLQKRTGLLEHHIPLHVPKNVRALLVEKGYDKTYGARQLKRALNEHFASPLARFLNTFDLFDVRPTQIIASLRKGQIHFEMESMQELAGELLMEELDHLALVNDAADLRRLLSESEKGNAILELKKRMEQKNCPQSQYHFDRFVNLKKKILAFEQAVGLEILNEISFSPKRDRELNDLKDEFLAVKKEICLFLFPPKESKCLFFLYGKNLAPFIDFYQSLFKALHFRYNLVSRNLYNSPKKRSSVKWEVQGDHFTFETLQWEEGRHLWQTHLNNTPMRSEGTVQVFKYVENGPRTASYKSENFPKLNRRTITPNTLTDTRLDLDTSFNDQNEMIQTLAPALQKAGLEKALEKLFI